MEIETSLGTVKLSPTDKFHIYCTGECTVRGVSISYSIHLYRWSDGVFHCGEEKANDYARSHSLYTSRKSWSGGRYDAVVSASARKKILDVVAPAVNEWIKDNQVDLDLAQEHAIQRQIEDRQGEIEILKKAIAVLKHDIWRLEQGELLSSTPWKSLQYEPIKPSELLYPRQ